MAGIQEDGEGQEEPAITRDRLELARIVTARIEELHLSRKEVANRSRISLATIREMEHPRTSRVFGRDVLEAVSRALDWPPDYLLRAIYLPSSEEPGPITQEMMTALAPYLEKIDAIPRLQEDVAAIKDRLGIDVMQKVDDKVVTAIDSTHTPPTE